MGKRKGRSLEESETLNHMKVEDEEEVEGKGGFFACYLLTSLSPRFKGHTYIGFTVNPKRRIRQHNGEIRCGAWRTKNKRPWEMVLCIYGFPTNIAALQFEWAWQHPVESLAVRKAAVAFKSLGGLANKIKLAYTMLTLPAWQSLDLTVNFFSTKYTKHSAGCPSLPDQMKVQICSMDELPCYGGEDWNAYENNELESDDGDDNNNDAFNFMDHQTNIEETTRVEDRVEARSVFGIIEDCTTKSDIDMRTRNQSPNRTDDRLIEDCTIESDIDIQSRNQLINMTGGDKSQSTIKSSTILPCEVEVIDVFTPSPSNRINSKRKKIDVFPEIIDLTNSPIFV